VLGLFTLLFREPQKQEKAGGWGGTIFGGPFLPKTRYFRLKDLLYVLTPTPRTALHCKVLSLLSTYCMVQSLVQHFLSSTGS